MIIKPNWNIFETKFTENPQNNFEWLCYLLFCKQFNKPAGIFRYKNQAALETNPIKDGDEVIGWQAKFYKTPLSQHKSDLIETLQKSKEYYPNISKLIFYTNQEWGQSKGQQPKGLIDVEQKASDLGISIVWNTASYFESEFVTIDNSHISGHFFNNTTSIFDVISKQQQHSENILREIRTGIPFGEYTIEIDRSHYIENLEGNRSRVTILCGPGGVGKTAVIKTFYEKLKGKSPFYLFKATEFDLRNLNDFLSGISINAFSEAHNNEDEKYIIIDSAEKLLDLHNQDPFKEFLSVLIKDNWKILFTTRNYYLDDLNFEFLEIYNIIPHKLSLKILEQKTLKDLLKQYSITFPKDQRLIELIRNPFYLHEYIKFYNNDYFSGYLEFKNKLWTRNIIRSKPAREQCFLKVAIERATSGQFFVTSNCPSELTDELVKDGILGYETAGYFITHDIYEEWALEKVIETEFRKQITALDFFSNIGQSLSIRRSFRIWLSEKLLLQDSSIDALIDSSISNQEIPFFWKDEILISILRSDYSETFFKTFSETLLKNNLELLKRLVFLLRLACKEVDTDFLELFGVKNTNILTLNFVLTLPIGKGWQSLIKYIFNHLDILQIKNLEFLLSVLHDWNSKFKSGSTTKFSALIALKYYEWHIANNEYFRNDEIKNQVIETVFYGAGEVKDELILLFEQVTENKWKRNNDPYYDLSIFALTELQGMSLASVLPNQVLQLANLFWRFTPYKRGRHRYHSRWGVEQYFNLEDSHQDYYPASAYQTPINWLLQSDFAQTIDFILDFTNAAVEFYASHPEMQDEVEKLEILCDNKTFEQYSSARLWYIYRGSQGAPHVLESMHMALEKYFLENGKNLDSETLEKWLLYLLKNTKSASISALIISVVLAFPDKTFNVAVILFKTKEFFLYDNGRCSFDLGHESYLKLLKNNFQFNSNNSFHENERIEAAGHDHRKQPLENLLRNYQYFRSDEISETQAIQRQEILWEILDNYYKQLPSFAEQSTQEKTWGLYLNRMDRRKINPTSKQTDDGLVINFNPELEPELQDFRDSALKQNNEPYKYIDLESWSDYKIRGDDKYQDYDQFENRPTFALEQVKQLTKEIEDGKRSDERFMLINQSIPVNVLTVLVRHHLHVLSYDDIVLCKSILIEAVSTILTPQHNPRTLAAAISTLPTLLERFPEEGRIIKQVLIMSLFKEEQVDLVGTKFNKFVIITINSLWESKPKDSESLFIGYLFLKPKYDALYKTMYKESYENGTYEVDSNEFYNRFLLENEIHFTDIADNNVNQFKIQDIKEFDLAIIRTAFQLLPNKVEQATQKEKILTLIETFANNLFSEEQRDYNNRIDYTVKSDFLEKFAWIVLSSDKEDIKRYLTPFLKNFNRSEFVARLFYHFINVEDILQSYENFWIVWELFKEKVTKVYENGEGYSSSDEIIRSYLFAQQYWDESDVSWGSFKEKEKVFFRDIAVRLGHCPSTLYAIAKLLNGIGTPFLAEGIHWISAIVENNPKLLNSKLIANTDFYLEKYLRKYLYFNKEKVKTTKSLKNQVLRILDFLVERGSATGYLLRERII